MRLTAKLGFHSDFKIFPDQAEQKKFVFEINLMGVFFLSGVKRGYLGFCLSSKLLSSAILLLRFNFFNFPLASCIF